MGFCVLRRRSTGTPGILRAKKVLPCNGIRQTADNADSSMARNVYAVRAQHAVLPPLCPVYEGHNADNPKPEANAGPTTRAVMRRVPVRGALCGFQCCAAGLYKIEVSGRARHSLR